MANLIRLKNEDTLRDLLDLLIGLPEKIVYIEIPLDSVVWQPEALRLLRRAGREAEKKIVIVSGNRVGRIRAEQAGLTALTPDVAKRSIKGSVTVPPKGAPPKKTLSQSPAEWVSRKVKGAEAVVMPVRKNRKLLFLGSAVLALIAGLTVANYIFQKAEITVGARTQNFEGSTDIIVNQFFQTPDVERKIIRGLPVSKTYTKQERFTSTGKRQSGGIASGSVVLQSSQPTTLRLRAATTYLEGPNGQRYSFKADVTGLQPNVPKTVEVVSTAGGEANNLPAGTRVEVHNSAFGYRPNVLYATVAEGGITGGNDQEVTVVSDSDLTNAHETLKSAMVNELRMQVTETEGKDFVLTEELMRFRVISTNADAKADEAKDNFTLSLTAEISALVFDKKNAVLIVDTEAKKQIDSSQTYLGSNMDEFQYSARSWDFEQGIAVVKVTYTSRTAARLSADDLKVLLAGRKVDEIKQILLKKPEIENVRIKLSPFWLTSTPKSPRNIEVRIELK